MLLFSTSPQALANLDAKRIYVENVRSYMETSEAAARWLCEKAVRDGFFEKWISYEHPTLGHILVEAPVDEPPEDRLYHCDVSESQELEKTDYSLSEMTVRYFYRAPLK